MTTKNRKCEVYVMAPLDVINEKGKPSYLNKFKKWCEQLNEGQIDGVMIDVWWGLVEKSPKEYNWEGYEELFKVMKNNNLKIAPVLSFHQCSGNVGDTVHIPLPSFVFAYVDKPYFVDKFGQKDYEYISFSYDSIKIGNRTPLEMYQDFMRSFRSNFEDYIKTGSIAKIEVGLGPCGELRYPSYILSRWEYPCSGSFQCYDEEFKQMFLQDAKKAGHPEWISPPEDTGYSYNEYPDGPTFWKDGYKSEFGKFFLKWYSDKLVEHGRKVLRIAREVFTDTKLCGKVAGIHWQYMHETRCSEATAGYYNTNGYCTYSKIAKMFKENDIDICFTCLEMKGKDEWAKSDPEGLVQEVFDIARKNGVNFEGENAIERYDWEAYNQVVKWASKGLHEFTFLRMTEKLMNEEKTWYEFKQFTEKIHFASSQNESKHENKNNKNNKNNNSKIKCNYKHECEEKENTIYAYENENEEDEFYLNQCMN